MIDWIGSLVMLRRESIDPLEIKCPECHTNDALYQNDHDGSSFLCMHEIVTEHVTPLGLQKSWMPCGTIFHVHLPTEEP